MTNSLFERKEDARHAIVAGKKRSFTLETLEKGKVRLIQQMTLTGAVHATIWEGPKEELLKACEVPSPLEDNECYFELNNCSVESHYADPTEKSRKSRKRCSFTISDNGVYELRKALNG